MSHKNKIDFISVPENSFINELEHMDENFRQFSLIGSIHNESPSFKGFIVALVTLAYLRVDGASTYNKALIPANASFESLTYTEGQNFFIDIFNRYKIICELNPLLTGTATILEQFFIAGAQHLSVEFQIDFAKKSHELDWSEKGFTNQDCGLYVECTLIRENLATVVSATVASYGDYPDLYIQTHSLAQLLNIRPDEKQLCSPILYNTYLVHLFEQLTWPINGCETLVDHLENVTAIQADPALWAIHTIETALFGCNTQLISKTDTLSKIHNNVGEGFDVIFLPEVSYDSIPDIGPIAIGDITIEKGTDSHNLYYVAFLYNLLDKNGRMVVRFDGKAETTLKLEGNDFDYINVYDADNLLAFFVDNNLIDAVIQTNNSTYMLVDKNRPEKKHGKILFYYGDDFGFFTWGQFCATNEKLAMCIKEYSCVHIQTNHVEGACIVSNKEIKQNGYRLLPKKYIYDSDRVIANAEYQVVRHIAHDLSPKLSTVDSVLKHIARFIASHDLLQEPLQEQFYEGQPLETVGEAIDKARSDISQMHKLIKATRNLITEEIPLEDFSLVNLYEFLEATKKKYATRMFALHFECDQNIQYEMHETFFTEMIDNFVRNAEIHGFTNGRNRTECKIVIVVTKNNNNLIVEIKNNGNHLPDEFTVEKFIDFGNKGKNSPGYGLGGTSIYKVIRAHRGNLEIIRDDKEYPANFKITLPYSEGNT